ncbi:MAG: ATPase, T2SS/T4P/T4SS family [Planctomycetota bacterium]
MSMPHATQPNDIERLLAELPAAEVFVRTVPISYARRHRVIGLEAKPAASGIESARLKASESASSASGRPAFGGVVLVHADATHPLVLDTLRRRLPRVVGQCVASAETIGGALDRAFEQRTGQANEAIERVKYEGDSLELLRNLDTRGAVSDGGGEDLLDGEGRAPVVKLVNALLFEACQLEASDIHLQPTEVETSVRMRIDGVLFPAHRLPRSVHEEVVSRVKVMAKMNIAEKRLPQDGRATVQVGSRKIDLRVSTVPTSFGERVVFRLLDKSARRYTLDELGMLPEVRKRFGRVARMEHGLVLVTGPTGSGKSTTLYGVLQEIDTTQLNALTLEDPIEYQLPGVSQMQVAERKGMTFAKGLRSVLRQDPDIVMVGEIRDRETAELAIQAALTGHLVFSTLHTNDAASSVTRLLDLGIEPYLVASSLRAVMAQRLVRRVCRECAKPLFEAEVPGQLLRLGLTADAHDVARMRVGAGCPACRDTGYRGRLGVFEFLPVGEELQSLIVRRRPAAELKAAAVVAGMQTLQDDGLQKILDGYTTPDEVLRVAPTSTSPSAPGSEATLGSEGPDLGLDTVLDLGDGPGVGHEFHANEGDAHLAPIDLPGASSLSEAEGSN